MEKKPLYIKNNDIFAALKGIANIDAYTDNIPREIADKIQLSLNITPQMNRIANVVKSGGTLNTATVNVYTTPTDKDFYLSSISLSVMKDATSTNTLSYVNLPMNDGSTPAGIAIAQLTLTAAAETISISFPVPILVKRGSAISVINTNVSLGNTYAYMSLTGFTVDAYTYDMGLPNE